MPRERDSRKERPRGPGLARQTWMTMSEGGAVAGKRGGAHVGRSTVDLQHGAHESSVQAVVHVHVGSFSRSQRSSSHARRVGFSRGRGRSYRRPSQNGTDRRFRSDLYYPSPTTIAAAAQTGLGWGRDPEPLSPSPGPGPGPGQDGASQPSSQSVQASQASLVGRSWASLDSRNHQCANYPRRRCVMSMWGSKSGPFRSSRRSCWGLPRGQVLGSFNPDR